MEEVKEQFIKVMRKFLKTFIKVLVFVALSVILLTGAFYIIVLADGSYKKGDWSNAPYVARQYMGGTFVNSNGTLSSNISAQELWDKMLENGSNIDEYLDSSKELAKLMNAEIITQYPDTRPDPNAEIKWEEIIAEDANDIQGIIKFKRADSNQNLFSLTYVSPEEFQGYVDDFNRTGSETAKKNALTHFTLQKASDTANNVRAFVAGQGVMTEVSQAIIDASNRTVWPGKDWCAKWVNNVYSNAGLIVERHGSAYADSKYNIISNDRNAIPIGATVYGTGLNSDGNGHVGIYLGGGQVIDSRGTGVIVDSLENWISWQKDTIEGKQGWLGWGWADANSIRGTTADSNITQNNSESNSMVNNDQQTSDIDFSYMAVIAIFEEENTTVTTNDPDVEERTSSQYTMTTTNINYQEMVDAYTMPFDLLWAFLVVGEDKDFVMELADLIYQSDIQITIYDNLTTNTEVDEWHYTKRLKADVEAMITAKYKEETESGKIEKHSHDPHNIEEEKEYLTTKMVESKTNTVTPVLTRANVWIVDYENTYTYAVPTENKNSDTITKDDELSYPDTPSSTGNSYSCEHINTKKEELRAKVIEADEKKNEQIITNQEENSTSEEENGEKNAQSQNAIVTFNDSIHVDYYTKYVKISDNKTSISSTQQYVAGVPVKKEKIESDSSEDNFVTIFNKSEYAQNRANINDVGDWLFEILETNESTADMVDLIKFLLQQANGEDYGIEEYDFSEYDASLFSNVTNIYGDTVKEKVWFTLRAAGYSEYATAAVMGNIQYESGFDTNKIEAGSGVGFGLCQWSYGRRNNLEAYAASKGESAGSIDIQIEFLLTELGIGGGANGYASYQLGGISSEKYDGTRYKRNDWEKSENLDTATIAFMAIFERPSYDPSINHIRGRREAAKQFYNEFHGKDILEKNDFNLGMEKSVPSTN